MITTKEIRVADSTNLKAAAPAMRLTISLTNNVTITSRRKRWIEFTLTHPIAGPWRPRARLSVS